MNSKMPPKAAGRSNHFQTPDWAVDCLVPYIKNHFRYRNEHKVVGIENKIWECAQGAGNIVQRLEHHKFDVIGTDIMNGFDFLSPLMPPPEFDVIVTNPPYSVKDEWLERCYEIGKPFALLMPITALGEQERFKMYKKHGIQVLMLPKRVDFETPSGEGSGAWFYCAWFCWGLLPDKICFAD